MPHSRHQSGRALGSLILLLVLLVGAGGWNYHRNLQREKATEASRPYRGYSLEDLQALRAAYESELQAVRARFDAAKRQRARPAGDVGSIAGNVEQFQRTTRASTAIRDAAGSVAERQAQVAELDRELEIRNQFGKGFERHLKLLTTI